MADNERAGDFGRSHPFPDGMREHLDRFRQGHILAEIPVFFASLGAPELWDHPRQLIAPDAPEVTAEPGGTLHRAMLVTQGCDLVRTDNPWVTVAPVYEASDRLNEGQRSNARGGKTRNLVHITADWAADGFWVADLRLELPIEKTALLSRAPIEAFSADVDYMRLAERLGARRARPDVPDDVLDYVARPIFDALRALPDRGAALNADIREIRVQCIPPLAPAVVTVFVIAKDDHSPEPGGWGAILDAVYQGAADHGITIVGPEVVSLHEMSAHDYLTSAMIGDASS